MLPENKTEEAVRLMETTDTTREPEILVYSRATTPVSKLADPRDQRTLKQAAQSGFVCATGYPRFRTPGCPHDGNIRSLPPCWAPRKLSFKKRNQASSKRRIRM